MEHKFVINTDLQAGVESYNVNSEETYDLYTIKYKNGKRENIRIYQIKVTLEIYKRSKKADSTLLGCICFLCVNYSLLII